MSIGEIFIWAVCISIFSAIGLIMWLAVMILSNKAQPLNQNEVENENGLKTELPSSVDNFFNSAWPLICPALTVYYSSLLFSL